MLRMLLDCSSTSLQVVQDATGLEIPHVQARNLGSSGNIVGVDEWGDRRNGDKGS
jgi:hypothetical protein